MLTTASTTMFIAARRVGIHGRLRAKKARLSSRLTPANGRLKANQNSAVETRCVERAALVDEPGYRCGECEQEPGRGNQEQIDLADPVAYGLAHPGGVTTSRHTAQRRKQDRGHRDAEDALRKHVDPERLVDRPRRLRGDERPEGRVDEQVEIDDPDAERDR